MESNFDQYIRRAACYMNDCPYGYDISCADCVKRMAAEHDANAITKFAEELKSRLGDAIHPKDFESMKNLIDDVARQMKEKNKMNDCFWCFINGVCDCNKCANCKEYISVNSERGMELYEKYEADVEEALKPVAEKWKQLRGQNNG